MKLAIFALIDFLAWPWTIALMCAALLPAAALGFLIAGTLHPVLAVCLVPAYYFIWLFSFLCLSALEMVFLGLFFKKPEKIVFLSDWKSTLFSVVLHNASKRLRLIMSVPFIETLLVPTYSLPFVYRLLFRAYSLRPVRYGSLCAIYSFPSDPDLLRLGNNVVIGADSMLVCHALKTTADGKMLYLTAPIVIDDNVTVGAGSVVSMGVTIGKGGLVTAMSHVEPHTQIGENEVWGGNPARFLRTRTEG
jgi:acetyltransferase-like isoleucine patch superfamily enzyme